MLSTSQKADILLKAGIAVPSCPAHPATGSQMLATTPQHHSELPDARMPAAIDQWEHLVNMLYVEYTAARTAKGLRDSEEAERLRRLQVANSRSASVSRRQDDAGRP